MSALKAISRAEAIDVPSRGPGLGRPLADHVKRARLHNLKELRPASAGASEIRILFGFDPARRAILLAAGDKTGNWKRWYDVAIPIPEARYGEHLKGAETWRVQGNK